MGKRSAFFDENGALRAGWGDAIYDDEGYLDEDVLAEATELLPKVAGDSDAARLYWADSCASKTNSNYRTRELA